MKKMIEATVCDVCGEATETEWMKGTTQLHGLAPIDHDICRKCMKVLARSKIKVFIGPFTPDDGDKKRASSTPPLKSVAGVGRRPNPPPIGWSMRDESTFHFAETGAKVERRDEGKWVGVRADGSERNFFFNKGKAFEWASGVTTPVANPDVSTDRLKALREAKGRLAGNSFFAK